MEKQTTYTNSELLTENSTKKSDHIEELISLPIVLPASKHQVGDSWNILSQWIHCICIVTFDLNIGQALEYVYPEEFCPNENEVMNICYSAFPDSNSGCMGDTKYHIRLRLAPDYKRTSQPDADVHRWYNNNCLSILKADESHYWGFVYFRQKRDPQMPRGYFQKSFIIITRLPFFNLFYELLGHLAPKYFNGGVKVLRDACTQINKWPFLQVNFTLYLSIDEYLYQIFIPMASSRKNALPKESTTQESQKDLSKEMNLTCFRKIASVNELDLFQNFSFVIDHLYTLWELVLTAEPIIVFGTSPADCSQMVQCLVALITPLEYWAEFRPYFTIHDSEFKEFIRDTGNAPPSLILGVTNPFFLKLLKDWPHFLRLVDNQINIRKQQQLLLNKRRSYKSRHSLDNETPTMSNSLNTNFIAVGSSEPSSQPGLFTKYKAFLKRDKGLIKKINLGIKMRRPDQVQTALIRRHLLELTQSFMIPLERYMASLMPLQKDINPFRERPNTNAFILDDFLSTLEQSGPQLTSPIKGDWKGLYRKFYYSPNFRGWYDSRYRELEITIQDLQLQALSKVDLGQWAHNKHEVEIIDMILNLKQKLDFSDQTNATGHECNLTSHQYGTKKMNIHQEIITQINCMKDMLPPDLRNIVNI